MGGEEAAVELRSVGAPAEFAFPPADHLALGASLGLLDFDAGAPPSWVVHTLLLAPACIRRPAGPSPGTGVCFRPVEHLRKV